MTITATRTDGGIGGRDEESGTAGRSVGTDPAWQTPTEERSLHPFGCTPDNVPQNETGKRVAAEDPV
jgi:hypothetical protein